MAKTETNDLPTHSDKASGDTDSAGTPIVTGEERIEATREPVDLTVDSEPDHARDLPKIDTSRYEPAESEIQLATWEDVRELPAMPPQSDGDQVVYVSVTHPNQVIFDRNGETILGQFVNGALATDNPKLKAILEDPRQRGIKRLDMGAMKGGLA